MVDRAKGSGLRGGRLSDNTCNACPSSRQRARAGTGRNTPQRKKRPTPCPAAFLWRGKTPKRTIGRPTPTDTAMFSTENSPFHRQQAGARAIHADSVVLIRQYDALRLQLVDLYSAVPPDVVAIDQAVNELAQLQWDIKGASGLIGNNPIED